MLNMLIFRVMSQTITKCRICQKEFIQKPWLIKGFVYCPHCHTAWPKKLEKEGYGKEYYQAKSGIVSFFFTPLWKLFYLKRNSYIKKNRVGKWIDVGAGDGGYLDSVKANKKVGVEVSKSGREIMEKKGIKTLSDKKYLNLKGANADVISFWHVLEHIKDPVKYLTVAKKNLKKNGEVVIGLPNIDSFEMEITKDKWFHVQPGYHEYLFSEKTVLTLLENTGFKVLSTDYWSIEHHLTGILQSLVNYSGGSLNFLHNLTKRRMRRNKIPLKDLLLIVFWFTLGMPVVILFWVLQSIIHQSGTIVVTATQKH